MIWSIAHLLTLLGIPLLSVTKDDQANFGDCRGPWGRDLNASTCTLYMSIQPYVANEVDQLQLGIDLQGPQLKHFITVYY